MNERSCSGCVCVFLYRQYNNIQECLQRGKNYLFMCGESIYMQLSTALEFLEFQFDFFPSSNRKDYFMLEMIRRIFIQIINFNFLNKKTKKNNEKYVKRARHA